VKALHPSSLPQKLGIIVAAIKDDVGLGGAAAGLIKGQPLVIISNNIV
jgi:hypothetical protein